MITKLLQVIVMSWIFLLMNLHIDRKISAITIQSVFLLFSHKMYIWLIYLKQKITLFHQNNNN